MRGGCEQSYDSVPYNKCTNMSKLIYKYKIYTCIFTNEWVVVKYIPLLHCIKLLFFVEIFCIILLLFYPWVLGLENV